MRLPRLTYANVASTLALVLAAAGGTAVAVQGLNADKVDGLNAAELDFTVNGKPNATAEWKTVLRMGGLVIKAKCIEESGYLLATKVQTTVNNAEVQAMSAHDPATPNLEVMLEREFDKGEAPPLPLPPGEQGQGTLTYSRPSGSHVTVVFQADIGSIMGGEKDCVLGGTALHAP